DGVSFGLRRGETLGLVGESGCGKSTTGLAILRMVPATRGRIVYEGADITHHDRRQLRGFRRHVQLVCQDRYGSLNPRRTVPGTSPEPREVHWLAARCRDMVKRTNAMLWAVGRPPYMSTRCPPASSSGQRPRIGIARALALEPNLLI